MQTIIRQILFHLDRSMAAYKLYASEKKYYQALRIYKANKDVYFLLTNHADLWKESETLVIEYLFHLEDWFEQFDELVRTKNPALENEFIFTRLEGSPAFPSGIYQAIKNTGTL
jgi:hypothetical protein